MAGALKSSQTVMLSNGSKKPGSNNLKLAAEASAAPMSGAGVQGSSINKSLLTLGIVIRALGDGKVHSCPLGDVKHDYCRFSCRLGRCELSTFAIRRCRVDACKHWQQIPLSMHYIAAPALAPAIPILLNLYRCFGHSSSHPSAGISSDASCLGLESVSHF